MLFDILTNMTGFAERPQFTDKDVVNSVQIAVSDLDRTGRLLARGGFSPDAVSRALTSIGDVTHNAIPNHPALGFEYGNDFAHDIGLLNGQVVEANRAGKMGRNLLETFIAANRHMLLSVLQEFQTTLSSVDLTGITNNVANMMRRTRSNLTVNVDINPEASVVKSQEDLLFRVLFNLAKNGVKGIAATDRVVDDSDEIVQITPGQLRIDTERVDDKVAIEVEDSGVGFSHHPFFTGRAIDPSRVYIPLEDVVGEKRVSGFKQAGGEGSGRGLQIILKYARMTEGQAFVKHPDLSRGAVVRVELPAATR